ncbi:MAG TPA: LysM peptidoglycan-binding domain-containing protein [Patescibacteria group bacterium]|nr:LysM peptidoglycan-binding domain-containing protein [Patescibacteria group bacterium]
MPKKQPSFTEKLQQYETEISSLLGMLVVLVLAGAIFFFIKRSVPTPQVSPNDQASQIEDLMKQQQAESSNTYTVKRGQGLSQVAKEVYHDGKKWTLIAEANNLKAPYVLEAGQKLNVPDAPGATAAPTSEPEKGEETEPVGKSDTTTYTVQKNDNLWEIAVAQYKDGYKWTKIYAANKNLIGKNPGIINAGQVLTLP